MICKVKITLVLSLAPCDGYHGSYPEVKRPRRVANTNLHLVSRSMTIGAIPLLPLYIFMDWTGEIYPLFTESKIVSVHVEVEV